jgi:peptide/nickel transport system substrate-binding protein
MFAFSAAPFAATAASASTTKASGASGTLNWYGAGTINTWDPALNSVGNDVKKLSLVYSGLTRLNPAGQPTGDLATSWSFSRNGHALTFTLRPGLTFTDGTPVTAKAVAYNINRDITNPESLVAPLLVAIKSETVISKYVVQLNLDQLDWELPGTLAGKAGEIVSPAALANPTQLAEQPVGAGPFKVTQYVANSYVDLVRNPSYWDSKDIHIQNIYLNMDTTASTILAAVQSGQANFAQITGPQVSAAEGAGFKVTSIQQFAVEYLGVNQAYAPFTNPLVTKAIGYAIDRKALVTAQTAGYGAVDDEPFPTRYFGYDPSKKIADYYTYDPAKAASLLAQAGYPNGKGLNLTLTTSLPSSVAQQIQAQLQALGATVTIQGIPSTEATQLEYVEHNVALFPNGFVGREAPIAALQIVYDQNGLLNPSRTASKALEAALANLRKTPISPRAAYVKAIQNVVALGVEQSSVYFTYQSPLLLATKGINGIQPYVDYQEFYGVKIAS